MQEAIKLETDGHDGNKETALKSNLLVLGSYGTTEAQISRRCTSSIIKAVEGTSFDSNFAPVHELLEVLEQSTLLLAEILKQRFFVSAHTQVESGKCKRTGKTTSYCSNTIFRFGVGKLKASRVLK